MSRQFDGVDDNISITSTSGFNVTKALTVACWFKLNALNQAALVEKWVLNLENKVLFLRDVGGNKKLSGYLAASAAEANGATTLTTGIWYHGAMIYNGATIKVYLNGAEDGTTNFTADADDSTGSILFGKSLQGLNFLNGWLAHVHWYSVAFTPSQLTQIMRFPGSIRNGLVGYWPLWGGSPEGDYSGNNNSGSVNAGTAVSSDNPPINGIFTVPKPELVQVF